MSIHTAMLDYLSPIITELVGKHLYLNVLPPDSVALLTDSETDETEFIGGSKLASVLFTLAVVADYSEEMDGENAEALTMLDEFREWIEEQEEDGNYPEFGDNINVCEIKNTQRTPSFASVSEDGKSAKYLFGVRVRYMEE